MKKSIYIQKTLLLVLALFAASTMMAGAQERAPRKAGEVRFNLPSPRKFFNVELPTPEKIIQIIEQVKEIIIPPMCPLPPEEPSVCSFTLNDVTNIEGNFDIGWRCTGNFKPCSIYADDVLVGQVNDSGTAKFNIGAKRTISYQLKNKNDNSCGTGVAHLFQTGKRPPQPAFTSAFTQSGYRWFNNADSATTLGSALADLNTSFSVSGATNFRLRLLVHVGNTGIAANTQSFKLQVATKGASCAASTYSDVCSTFGCDFLFYNNNATPSDGDAIATVSGDPTHTEGTVHANVLNTYQEANPAPVGVAVESGQDVLTDFSLRSSGGTGEFCLRVVKSDGTALDSYQFYPEVTITGGYGFGGSSSPLAFLRWAR